MDRGDGGSIGDDGWGMKCFSGIHRRSRVWWLRHGWSFRLRGVKLEGEVQSVGTVWDVREKVEYGKNMFEGWFAKKITTSDRWRVYRNVRTIIALFIVQHKDWGERNNNCCISPST
jgi:hypothetical protein